MNPGRELDALVAEKVFGCKVEKREGHKTGPVRTGTIGELIGRTEYTCNCPTMDYVNDFGAFDPKFPHSDNAGLFSSIKHYSSEIAAAWEIVERMRERHHWTRIELNNFGKGTWLVNFEIGGATSGESAPHAICLAALKAVEGK